MIEVCRYLSAIDPAHRSIWVEFWQEARATREDADSIELDKAAAHPDATARRRRELWGRHVKALGEALKGFEAAAASKHRADLEF
jgi:hypothetical protein